MNFFRIQLIILCAVFILAVAGTATAGDTPLEMIPQKPAVTMEVAAGGNFGIAGMPYLFNNNNPANSFLLDALEGGLVDFEKTQKVFRFQNGGFSSAEGEELFDAFRYLDAGLGYFVWSSLNNPSTISYSGKQYAYRKLEAGFNLTHIPTKFFATVTDFLNKFNNNGWTIDKIYQWTGTGYASASGSMFDGFTNFEQGKGYFVHVVDVNATMPDLTIDDFDCSEYQNEMQNYDLLIDANASATYDVDFKLYGNQTGVTIADVIPATALQSPEIVNGTSQASTQIQDPLNKANTFSVYASFTPGTPPSPGQDVFVDVDNDESATADFKLTFVGAATGKTVYLVYVDETNITHYLAYTVGQETDGNSENNPIELIKNGESLNVQEVTFQGEGYLAHPVEVSIPLPSGEVFFMEATHATSGKTIVRKYLVPEGAVPSIDLTDVSAEYAVVDSFTGTTPPSGGEPSDDFVYVEAGTDAGNNVTINEPFYICKYEVTNQQMADVMQWAFGQEPQLINASSTTVTNAEGDSQELLDLDDGPCQISFSGGTFSADPGKEVYPCVEMTWYGAAAYCNYLSAQEGMTPAYDLSLWTLNSDADGYRLPSEEQWEYAARGGKDGMDTEYSGSDTIDEVAWYGDNSGGHSHEVGTKTANELCIYDLSGNIAEWCQDWHEDYVGSARVLRGGAWTSYFSYCRVSIRFDYGPSYSSYYSGFRPVLPPGQ